MERVNANNIAAVPALDTQLDNKHLLASFIVLILSSISEILIAFHSISLALKMSFIRMIGLTPQDI